MSNHHFPICSTIIFSTSILSLIFYNLNKKKTVKDNNVSFDSKLDVVMVVPPLPEDVVQLLSSTRLAHLATQSNGEPHLSLMNYTYYQKDECIIMCTRKNTKKYIQILESNKVAILVHDFPSNKNTECDSNEFGRTYSITLNGYVEISESGSKECEELRNIHLNANPLYANFIVGEEIAVIKVRIESARLCDIKDHVRVWTKKNGLTSI